MRLFGVHRLYNLYALRARKESPRRAERGFHVPMSSMYKSSGACANCVFNTLHPVNTSIYSTVSPIPAERRESVRQQIAFLSLVAMRLQVGKVEDWLGGERKKKKMGVSNRTWQNQLRLQSLALRKCWRRRRVDLHCSLLLLLANVAHRILGVLVLPTSQLTWTCGKKI